MKKIILVSIIVVMVLGCAKEQATNAEFAEVTFSVDRSLLSAEYICSDIGISFYPIS